MGQCRVGMAGRHWPHAFHVLDNGRNKAKVNNRDRRAMHACAAAGAGFTAVRRGRRFVDRRGLRLFCGPGLVMLVALHRFVGGRRGFGDDSRRRHVTRMNSGHGRRGPVEYEGHREQQSQQEGPDGHGRYFTL